MAEFCATAALDGLGLSVARALPAFFVTGGGSGSGLRGGDLLRKTDGEGIEMSAMRRDEALMC